MASNSHEVDVASFEPGILEAPAVLDALYRAGTPVVPGSDTGLPGHGLSHGLRACGGVWQLQLHAHGHGVHRRDGRARDRFRWRGERSHCRRVLEGVDHADSGQSRQCV